jgi:23S rRNA (guanosine2251-2'-O)-methyltransferase
LQIVYGLNPVLELLRAGRRKVKEIIYSREELPGEIKIICDERSIPLIKGDVEKYARGAVHQGIVAKADPYPYLSEKEMEGNFFVLLDGIEDPRNLGAVIRSAYAFGVEGIFLPQKGSAKVTPVVLKTSAGTAEWMKIALVKKTFSIIKKMKEKGFIIISLDERGEKSLEEIPPAEKIMLVIGSEGKGIKKSVLAISDLVVRIHTKVSLNLSVACGIALFSIKNKLPEKIFEK